MAFNVRSLAQLSLNIRGYIRTYLTGTDATLQQSFVYVIGKVLSLLSREYELRLSWIFKQLFVRTVTDISILRMHGADYKIYQKPAAAASGKISGTGQPGQSYPAGVRFVSSGTSYVTTEAFTAATSDGSYVARVQAESVGALTNRDAEAILSLADPSLYPSLGQQAMVVAGLGGGADIEDLESLRKRILTRKAQPPQGGSLSDYEQMARDVPGVLKSWAFAFSGGVGSIAVYFLFEDRPNNIPAAADVAAVQASIDAKRLIRVDDGVALAPIPTPLNVTIGDLSTDSDTVRAAIEKNLRAMLYERGRPGVSSDPFVLSRSWISEAISAAAGEDSHSLITPADQTLIYVGGQMPVLGIVAYA